MLERLIGERRISATEIERYVGEMGREISDLEQRLARLRDAAGPAVAAAAAGIAAGVAGAAAVRAGRRRGRPPGSGKKPGRPGRPPGSGRKPGRPPASASSAASTPSAGSTQGAGAKGGAKRGRKGRSAITPEQLASRQLQGRYLALVRQFSENKRTQYAKIAKEKGREAAINQMQSDSKK